MLLSTLIDVCVACGTNSLGWGSAAAGGAGAAAGSYPGDGPSGEDIAKDVYQGLAQDTALDLATHYGPPGAGSAAAAAGLAGAAVSGSQSLAEGLTHIYRNKGRGLGGSSKAGRSSMEAAMAEISGKGSAVGGSE